MRFLSDRFLRMPSLPFRAANGDTDTKPKTRRTAKTARPRMHKVILLNDDYTPREFVVEVLKGVFRTTEEQAQIIMLTAHQKGSCVVAVFTKEIAESKAHEANMYGQEAGFPLNFTTEPEE